MSVSRVVLLLLWCARVAGTVRSEVEVFSCLFGIILLKNVFAKYSYVGNGVTT